MGGKAIFEIAQRAHDDEIEDEIDQRRAEEDFERAIGRWMIRCAMPVTSQTVTRLASDVDFIISTSSVE